MASRRRLLAAPLALLAVTGLTACGTQSIELAADDPENVRRGAALFDQRCSGCHSIDTAGAQGSAVEINDREYKDGPNFNERVEGREDILYAIRNGGFSSGPMPQNIVTGQEAEDVAAFLEKYSGQDASRTITPNKPPPSGAEE